MLLRSADALLNMGAEMRKLLLTLVFVPVALAWAGDPVKSRWVWRVRDRLAAIWSSRRRRR